MKNLLHISLCGPVTDGFGYQDNLLPKYHKKLGYIVTILTSKFIYNSSGKLVKDSRNYYFNENNIKVIRLDSNKKSINSRFNKYNLLRETLREIRPDILFIHGIQFMDVNTIIKFIIENQIKKVYVDNHADFENSARNFISKYLIHKLIWKKNAKKIEPFVKTFYGVTPARCNFLRDMYKIPKSKIKLLNLGIDDEILNKINEKKSIFRKNITIEKSKYDYTIVSGGKFDLDKKNILNFIKAFKKLERLNLIFIFFGSISDDIKNELNKEINNVKNIKFLGWLSYMNSVELFYESDLVVFTGKHSVMWEQAFAIGKPILVSFNESYDHLNFGENIIYSYDSSVDNYTSLLDGLFGMSKKIDTASKKAKDINKVEFYYSNIALRAVS